MHYILKHKDIDVLIIDFNSLGTIKEIKSALNKDHVPVGCLKENGTVNEGFLNTWWNNRGIPKDREGLMDILRELKMKDKNELLIKGFGLSLTDHYWVCPEKIDFKWDKINFYTNDFSRDIGKLFFGRKKENQKYNPVTPDVSSDGKLPKYWDILNEKRILVKGGSAVFYQEPFNEVLAGKICDMLKIDHVDYTVYKNRREDNNYYGYCENMTDQDKELIYASRLYDIMNKNLQDSNYEHFVKCCKKSGVQNIEQNLNKMIVLDFLTANRDRHWNNFGLIRDSNTLKYIGAAPLYDSGSSFWSDRNTLPTDRNSITKSKCFADTNYEQLKYVTDFSWYDSKKLQKIPEYIEALFSHNEELNKERRNNIIKCFNNNVTYLDILIDEGVCG